MDQVTTKIIPNNIYMIGCPFYFSVFSITRDGSIVLESLLSRDITKYSLAIAVHDSSDNQNRNTQTVDIVLNVNSMYFWKLFLNLNLILNDCPHYSGE